MTGVGGPGGFATNVGFSPAPLSTRPLPGPPEMPPNLTVDVEEDGRAGDCGFNISDAAGGLGWCCSIGAGAGSSA